jgi:predicted TIM-barrel fold metal-dependent hydrolase
MPLHRPGARPVYNHLCNAVPAMKLGSTLAVLLLLCLAAELPALERVADVHLHYKWSQQDVTTVADALAILEAENIVMGVVIGTPAELALQLAQQAPDRIVPLFSPYRAGGDWHNWAYDSSVVARARAALASGAYYGIGELHLIGGFAPRGDKARVLPALLELAGEYDVPVMLHTEFSRPDLLLELCAQFPDTRIVWAHAGAILAPLQVARVLAACGNVSADLAARDPWRFVDNPVTDADGRLLPEWRALLIKYQDRFMLGSDPVWPVEQLDRWDEPDSGWQQLGRFWNFHRSWLQQLPAPAARNIGCENAVALFRPGGQLQCATVPEAAP